MIFGRRTALAITFAASMVIAACGGGSSEGEPVETEAGQVESVDTQSEVTTTSVASSETTPATDPTTSTSTTTTTTTTSTTTTTLPATMPNLVGLSVEDATAELSPFNVRVTTNNRIAPEAAGTVIEQDPLGGADFDVNVTLTVSVAPPTVPDVTNATIGDGLEALENLGFTVKQVDQFDEQAVDGEILAQEPPAGTENVGEVTVTVARRPVVVFLDELVQISGGYSFGAYNANGTTYDRSFQMSSDRSVEYDLSRDYRRLVISVGVDDASEIEKIGRVAIFGDGRDLRTVDIAFGQTVEFDVDVTDVLRLRIEHTGLESSGRMVFGRPRLYAVPGEI